MQCQTASALFPRRPSYSMCPACACVCVSVCVFPTTSSANQEPLRFIWFRAQQHWYKTRNLSDAQAAEDWPACKGGVGVLLNSECWRGRGQTRFKFAHLNTEVRWHGPFSSGCFRHLLCLQYRLPVFSHFGGQNRMKLKDSYLFLHPLCLGSLKNFATFLLRPTPNFSPLRRHCCVF